MSGPILIDVLLKSKELKRLLVERSFRYQIPLKRACYNAGVDYHKFLHGYVNSNSCEGIEISESQFLRIMSEYGIKLRYQFVIDENFDKEIEEQKILNSGKESH